MTFCFLPLLRWRLLSSNQISSAVLMLTFNGKRFRHVRWQLVSMSWCCPLSSDYLNTNCSTCRQICKHTHRQLFFILCKEALILSHTEKPREKLSLQYSIVCLSCIPSGWPKPACQNEQQNLPWSRICGKSGFTWFNDGVQFILSKNTWERLF